ncbi:LAGLIDADG family homing endonuclease [Bacillus thuringiensis]|uniref:LAGLIDADG family homing endonuclease n=1 Tax=Bacillus thuringiensis TaxID=1428 RepID=UPI003D049410
MTRRNYRKWNDADVLFLKENADKFTIRVLGEKLGRNESSIRNKLTALKIKKKVLTYTTYSYNRDFFENIDCEEKAYWLGFIAADGCILGGGRTGKRLKISLQKGDKAHLEQFVADLDGNIKIKEYKYRTKKGYYEHVEVSVGSNKLCHDLEALNITKAKSKTLKMSKIHDKLIRHYLRGYIDGDGHFYLSNNQKKSYIEIYIGSNSMLNYLTSYLNNQGITNYKFHYKKKGLYKIATHDIHSKARLIDLLYRDSTIFLGRKRDKALKIIQSLGNHRISLSTKNFLNKTYMDLKF